MKTFTLTLLCVLTMGGSAFAQKTGRDRVLKIDAVELIDQHREVEGNVAHQSQHGKYTYLFASEAHRQAFDANPAKYEIQLGGACGRMGPLSGEGSPKLFAVHDGRLYIFASEQCKRSFLAAPEKLLDRDDHTPATTEQSIRRGRELVDRAVNALGGAAKLDGLVSYREGLSRETESGGKKYIVTDTTTLLLLDGVRNETCWNDTCFANTVVGDEGWSVDSGGSEELIAVQRAALLRSAGRHPLALLRARGLPGWVITSDGGKRTIESDGEGAIELELFSMHREGATTTLGVDAGGRVRLLEYLGRGPTLAIGNMQRVYSKFKDIGGLMLPTHVEVIFEGKPAPDESGTFAVQAIDDASDRALFARPASLGN